MGHVRCGEKVEPCLIQPAAYTRFAGVGLSGADRAAVRNDPVITALDARRERATVLLVFRAQGGPARLTSNTPRNDGMTNRSERDVTPAIPNIDTGM